MLAKKLGTGAVLCALVASLAGCSKPNEDLVHSTVVSDLEEQGVATDVAEHVADCAAPKLHDELSATSLEAIVEDGILDAMIDKSDAETGEAIVEDCFAKVDGD